MNFQIFRHKFSAKIHSMTQNALKKIHLENQCFCYCFYFILNISITDSFLFCIAQKRNKPACRRAGNARLIFISLKTTPIPYPANGNRCARPSSTSNAAELICFTTDIKSRPEWSVIICRHPELSH